MSDRPTLAQAEEPDRLLWLDLETTGSDADRDDVIEIGCILTTLDLEELGEFSVLVRPTDNALGRMIRNPVVRTMHLANGLLAAILDEDAKLPEPYDATKAVIAWAESLGAKRDKTILAGSGVSHFDRRFIARHLRDLNTFLRYWCIDTGVIRRAHEAWVGLPPSNANDGKTHRALDDARCHLAEGKAYRNLWRQQGRFVEDIGKAAAPFVAEVAS